MPFGTTSTGVLLVHATVGRAAATGHDRLAQRLTSFRTPATSVGGSEQDSIRLVGTAAPRRACADWTARDTDGAASAAGPWILRPCHRVFGGPLTGSGVRTWWRKVLWLVKP